MKKLQKIAVIGLVAVAASVMANVAVAGTQAQVTVNNQSLEEAVFGFEHFFGSVDTQPGKLLPGEARTFTLNSPSNLASGMRFTYTAGKKKCRFSASHTTRPLMSGAIPSWKKDADSIGSARATCMANFTRTSPKDPFNYNVEFTLR